MENFVKSKKLSQTRAKRLKRCVLALCTGLCMATMLSMTVFASGVSVSSSGFMSSAETAFKAVVTLIGGGIGILGVINLVTVYSEENPSAKSSGMKQLAAGVGLVICANLLVPAIFSMVSGL
ncbi:MAG: Maff2 family protein [Ruminococcus sp.]|nr:Maff2 family protein [Ruminococcus sp.]